MIEQTTDSPNYNRSYPFGEMKAPERLPDGGLSYSRFKLTADMIPWAVSNAARQYGSRHGMRFRVVDGYCWRIK